MPCGAASQGWDVGDRHTEGVSATAADPPTAEVPTLLYLIKQVELAAKMRLEEILEPHDVTAVQYTALTVLARNPGLTSARLARNTFVRIQSMAQTMSALEEKGLISRETDPESRRQLRTSITPAGRRLMRELSEPIAALERELFEHLTPEEAAVFESALRHARLALGGSHAY